MESKIIAQKFGGTSVATAERRQMIVEHVRRELDAGYKIAMVISAMGRRGDPYATDTLLDLLRAQGGEIDPQHYSFLFVTGEMISVGVMAHTLHRAGLQATPLTGGMAGIETEDFPMSAGVTALNPNRLKDCVQAGQIPVVCGGQGLTRSGGNFSILGRGGSDTSGVLVGIMLEAERADIYTDVEYMLATDPRLIPNAPKRPELSFATAWEIARFGAKVVHPGSVRLGMQHNLPIRVRSTFSQNPGTLIYDTQDIWPLSGLPLMGSVQIAELNTPGITESQWHTMEQHVGLLHLVDSASGNTILCAPSGDTVSVVDQEIKQNGISPVSWHPGFSLISLIGSPTALPEMDQHASRLLGKKPRMICYHEATSHRATFAVPESEGKNALVAVYEELAGYLEPNR
jgi:aspartate kinase